MSVIIKSISKNSPTYNMGIEPGDVLISINGHDIVDVLDYRFYQLNRRLILKTEDKNNNIKEITIHKKEYSELGLEFETYLMDRQRHCKNKCIFCFIDQLPEGLRNSLYFKDDDSRLSFLFGNYITLTNLTRHEIDRIINLHISPVNVSVHTTDRELRCMMMGNKNAGSSLDILNELCGNGISVNCQIVVCPGINDGDVLKATLESLGKLYPSVQNIAVVPVGLTKHRKGLYPLKPFNKAIASETLKIVSDFGNMCLDRYATRLAYCADEIYLKADKAIPDAEFYEDFNQLENGVGMIALMKDELCYALEHTEFNDTSVRSISVATGESSYNFIRELTENITNKYKNINCNVIKIKNDFLGHNITVSGLITGTDLINQLKGRSIGDELLISASMLKKDENIFLDDVSVGDIERELNIKVVTVTNNGEEFLKCVLGCDLR